MLTWEPTMQVHALHAQGWTISAIARHVGINRRTVRAYLAGREPGRRVSPRPEAFTPYAEYVRLRLTDDPHVWASTLFDEVRDLGYAGGYQSFTRGLRAGRLRPHCEPCAASRGRDHAIIDHPPGEETQWDWVELPDPPPGWGWGSTAYLLVGALSHSSKWRGVLAENTDQPHLVEALDGVVRRLGGVTRRWRFDRMATVCTPATGRITASFGAIAVYYAVEATTCPARHGNRKGVVEKANHSAAQRWWRTLGDDVTVAQAQASLDRFCGRVGDSRPRRRDGQKTSVAALADAERLRAAPQGPYPVTVEVATGGVGAGDGRLPGQFLLGAARAGRQPDPGSAPARRGRAGGADRGRGGARPPSPRTRRRGRAGPCRGSCERAGEAGAGRVQRPGAVPGQATPPAVGGRVGRGGPAPRPARHR